MISMNISGRVLFLCVVFAAVILSCEEEVAPPPPPDWPDYITETRVIRDIDFIRNKYFWLNDPDYGGLPADDMNFNLDVWVEINPADKLAQPDLDWMPGKAFYDPNGDGDAINSAAQEILSGRKPTAPHVKQDFKRLVEGRDFLFISDFHTRDVMGIALTQPVPEDKALAVNYTTVRHPDAPGSPYVIGGPYSQFGIPVDVGGVERDTMLLELIKAKNPRPDNEFGEVWNYMMRNFYNLGITDIDPALFKLTIHDNTPRLDTSTPTGSTIPYIRIFGLDQINTAYEPKPDGRVDVIYINIIKGIIKFPSEWSFAPPADSVMRWTDGGFTFHDGSIMQMQYDKSLRMYTEYLINPLVDAYQYDIVVEVKRLE
jgi:hypothetical protein